MHQPHHDDIDCNHDQHAHSHDNPIFVCKANRKYN